MLGARRRHLDDEIGCTPDMIPDDVRALAGNEQQVGLHDEAGFLVEHDIHR
jgi:hypothetical protein